MCGGLESQVYRTRQQNQIGDLLKLRWSYSVKGVITIATEMCVLKQMHLHVDASCQTFQKRPNFFSGPELRSTGIGRERRRQLDVGDLPDQGNQNSGKIDEIKEIPGWNDLGFDVSSGENRGKIDCYLAMC